MCRASRNSALIWSSVAPSKTAVAAFWPLAWSAQPRCVSRIWPMFIRLGTPSGLRMMSTGVPSGRNGMSSAGRILAMTPLLPWRPAILSPTLILRFWATDTRASRVTPGWRASLSSRRDSRISTSLPRSPRGRRADADDDRVLVVAALPAHERHEDVPAKGELALLGRRAVGNRLAEHDAGADVDDRALVDAGALVAADELLELVLVELAGIGLDPD